MAKINEPLNNPSTADHNDDDPTIIKCIKYAQNWGYGGLLIGNLFAYRATNPSEMKKVDDPVGPLNNHYLKLMSQQVNQIGYQLAYLSF